MPGPLLHIGASVLCAHGGTATPTTPNPRVLLGGLPSVTLATPYVIAGCPFTTGTNPMPCVMGQWLVAATRVFSNGQPLVLLDSQSICTPNGTPMMPVMAQSRVIGS
jgi:hypothetical protein